MPPLHRQPQPRVGAEVTAAGTRRHRDLTDDAGPYLAALLVLATLAVLDIGPFAVSCHGILSKKFVTLRAELYF